MILGLECKSRVHYDFDRGHATKLLVISIQGVVNIDKMEWHFFGSSIDPKIVSES